MNLGKFRPSATTSEASTSFEPTESTAPSSTKGKKEVSNKTKISRRKASQNNQTRKDAEYKALLDFYISTADTPLPKEKILISEQEIFDQLSREDIKENPTYNACLDNLPALVEFINTPFKSRAKECPPEFIRLTQCPEVKLTPNDYRVAQILRKRILSRITSTKSTAMKKERLSFLREWRDKYMPETSQKPETSDKASSSTSQQTTPSDKQIEVSSSSFETSYEEALQKTISALQESIKEKSPPRKPPQGKGSRKRKPSTEDPLFSEESIKRLKTN